MQAEVCGSPLTGARCSFGRQLVYVRFTQSDFCGGRGEVSVNLRSKSSKTTQDPHTSPTESTTSTKCTTLFCCSTADSSVVYVEHRHVLLMLLARSSLVLYSLYFLKLQCSRPWLLHAQMQNAILYCSATNGSSLVVFVDHMFHDNKFVRSLLLYCCCTVNRCETVLPVGLPCARKIDYILCSTVALQYP